ESVGIPIVANGDVTTLDQAIEIAEKTGVDGVMAANGLLYNPAMFAGYEYTPASCVRDFVSAYLHQHLIYMLRELLTPAQRRVFHELSSRPAIEDYLDNVLMINDID
ncbi:hypothetical protein OSTOST_17676, partial [Ostertagia ostertagi]